MKCRLLFVMEAGPSAPDDICVVEDGVRFVPAGGVIDNPDAWKLVHAGHAESVDDECREKVATLDRKTIGLMRQVHNRITENMEDFQDEKQEEARIHAEEEEDELDEDE